MQETNGTIGGAIELARNFDTVNRYESVNSTLIYGVQWDAVMKWMEDIQNPNVEGKTYIQNSTRMGWYESSTPKTTGFYAVNNVYDLAGNVWEWTLEKSTNTGLPSVRRGGDCSYSGSDFTAFRRGIISASVSDDTIGFRPALY